MISFILITFLCGLAGAYLHEIAHWSVWKLTGRTPELDWIELVVRPRTGPTAITPSDRLAAAAPYALAISLLPAVLQADYLPFWIGLLFLVQFPSKEDRVVMLGRGTWDLPAQQHHGNTP